MNVNQYVLTMYTAPMGKALIEKGTAPTLANVKAMFDDPAMTNRYIHNLIFMQDRLTKRSFYSSLLLDSQEEVKEFLKMKGEGAEYFNYDTKRRVLEFFNYSLYSLVYSGGFGERLFNYLNDCWELNKSLEWI